MSESGACPAAETPGQTPLAGRQVAAAAGSESAGQRALSPGLVRLMAVTCAVTVANLYYAQPLLHSIGDSLHVSQGSAALLVTLGQLGYAAGLLFIVPAGDIMRRRPLLTGLLAFCAITLAGAALAPNLAALAAAVALCCVTSVVVQMLVPYAATLATDNERSRVIGTLMGGLLIGILLSRTFAGVVAEFGGWRTVYGIAAVLMALTAVMLRRVLPDHAPQLTISYREQLRGVLDIARAEPALRWRSLIAACGFGSFGAFWTTVTFLLSGPQYGFSQLAIGLFALVGAAGAITSLAGGRVLDKRPELRWPVTGASLALLAASYILIGLGGAHRAAAGQPRAADHRRAAHGRLRAGRARHQPERHLRPAAAGPLPAYHRLRHDDVRGRRGRLGGRRPGLRALGLDRRDPGRGRVPGTRPAVLAGLPPPRGRSLTAGQR